MAHDRKPARARTGTLSGLRRSLANSRGRRGRGPGSGRWRDLGGLLTVALVVVVVCTSLVIRMRRRPASVSEPSPATVPLQSMPDTQWDETWPRFTITGFPARPLEEIRAAYAFAARRPDVLRSMPCYCGCKRQGHESNEACYVKSRSPAGVARWTEHAVTCGICVDITHDAAVMAADHKPIAAIRSAIEVKYQER